LPEALVEATGLHTFYGSSHVLHGVDFRVGRGETVGLLGRNGMGKTTLLRSILGLTRPAEGEIVVKGRSVARAAPHAIARMGLAFVPEGRGIFPNLTVRENLRMATQTGVKLRRIEEIAYGRFPRLAERRAQLAGTLSGGEQQMLAMARALSVDTAVLLLDELSMGLAPLIVEELYGLVAQVAREGVSILVIEQFARTVLGIADIAAIMLNGRVASVGAPHDIEQQLQSAYLGGQQ
jgi:branched-chain amino acid transport system ATP-binding protein